MPAAFKHPQVASRFFRMIAGGCAALVLALTIFGASPVAHGCLHDADSDHGGSGDTCAVVMFAGGVALPVGPIALTPPTTVAEPGSSPLATEVLLVSPRYLRQPERGPPSGLFS